MDINTINEKLSILGMKIVIKGSEILAPLAFWQDKNHEIDFVLSEKDLLEVKRGRSSTLEFNWFQKQFPTQTLTVINTDTFSTGQVNGITLESFLLENEIR